MVLSCFLSIFCTLFVMIVMLNLLISIIGNTYARVQDNQDNEYYQEKASIIFENCYLISEKIRNACNEKVDPLLLFAAKPGQIVKETDDLAEVEKEEVDQNNDLLIKIQKIFENQVQNKVILREETFAASTTKFLP